MNLSPAIKRQQLRQLINGQDAVVAPGIYDAFGAKLVTNAEFPAVYLTGNGVSASLLGHPDIGQVDLTLIADHARRIAACTNLPLICDADTGYGGLFNIQRTVQEFEAAGVSAIHIEDQRFPKRCAQFEGARSVLDFKEAVNQIKAASLSRVDDNFMIIARTDCAASLGLDNAIERARAFISEGADAVFVELKPSPNAVEMIRRIKDEVKSTCMFNVDVGGAVSELQANQMKSLGIDIAIHPSLARGVFGYAMQQALIELKSSGNIAGLRQSMLTGAQYNASLGLADFEDWEKKFFN